MNEYRIFTDSACDLSAEVLRLWGVKFCSLSFMFDGESRSYENYELPAPVFYQFMRDGKTAQTSAINPDSFSHAFERELKKGRDILYLGFSSALSTTCNSARIAAEELTEQYPDRKILVVDTLGASAGQGLLVYLTVQHKRAGASIEEAARFAEENKQRVCQWFTTDTLTYLKRGGRVSSTSAVFGNMLDIRPLMHVDKEGKLTNTAKLRGRKATIRALADKAIQSAEEGCPIFISHADCEEDAIALAHMIRDARGLKPEIITDVGPVIGAHAGPGTLALFFVGTDR
ncbi:MAG: DegV family protein [Oscillospiraceae bacterium]|nr:DegV family protein [Oscillospiraceae bacterium]